MAALLRIREENRFEEMQTNPKVLKNIDMDSKTALASV